MKSILKNIIDKILKISGGVYAIISMTIGVSLILISMFLYPGYDMRTHYVSSLGTGPGGIIFCLGLIFAGFIAIYAYVELFTHRWLPLFFLWS